MGIVVYRSPFRTEEVRMNHVKKESKTITSGLKMITLWFMSKTADVKRKRSISPSIIPVVSESGTLGRSKKEKRIYLYNLIIQFVKCKCSRTIKIHKSRNRDFPGEILLQYFSIFLQSLENFVSG